MITINIQRFLNQLQDIIKYAPKIDFHTLNIIFDIFYKNLATIQRKDYNVLTNEIQKLIDSAIIIKDTIYQITIDDLETILENFKI